VAFSGFDADFRRFLRDLAGNNDREWFQASKARFQESVQEPMHAFIEAIEPRLKAISPHLTAVAKKVGGSMKRLNRDVRFSKDKSPYATEVGVRFLHEDGSKAPVGCYLSVGADQVVLGAGYWQPEPPALARIRDAIVADPKRWQRARSDTAFRKTWGDLAGESLKRPPRGYDADHPCVEDLKRKDFVAFRTMPAKAIEERAFLGEAAKSYAASKPLLAFLCEALGMRF